LVARAKAGSSPADARTDIGLRGARAPVGTRSDAERSCWVRAGGARMGGKLRRQDPRHQRHPCLPLRVSRQQDGPCRGGCKQAQGAGAWLLLPSPPATRSFTPPPRGRRRAPAPPVHRARTNETRACLQLRKYGGVAELIDECGKRTPSPSCSPGCGLVLAQTTQHVHVACHSSTKFCRDTHARDECRRR